MNVDAIVKLYYLALVISTLAVIILAVVTRRHTFAFKNQLFIFGPVIAVGFFLLVSSMGFNSSPNSCVFCHEMLPEYDTWRKSTHARATCLACHLRADGALGYIAEDAEALREVWAHFTGYPKIINRHSELSEKYMDSAVCERCHNQTKLGSFRFGDRVEIDHQAHIKLKISCEYCHNRVAHKGARGFSYIDGLHMMDGCMRCHLPGRAAEIKGKEGQLKHARRAPTSCTTCHVKNLAEAAFGKKTASKADFEECRNCHRLRDPNVVNSFARSKMSESAVDCSDCHKSHFGRLIPDPDPTRCDKCHSGIAEKVAERKHGRKMKDGKLKSPPTDPKKVRCTLCHEQHRFAIPQ